MNKNKTLRFYLASAFSLREKVQAICDILEARGHVVPVQWWDHTADAHEAKAAPGSDDDFYNRKTVQMTAARDFGGVTVSDVFILVAEEKPRAFNGAFVELGWALAMRKPCFVIGRLERSAMFAHVRRVDSIEQVLSEVLA